MPDVGGREAEMEAIRRRRRHVPALVRMKWLREKWLEARSLAAINRHRDDLVRLVTLRGRRMNDEERWWRRFTG